MSNEWYREGRVSVQAESRSVVGTGTSWLEAGVRAGDVLILNGAPLEISSVEADDSLLLVDEYPGETVAGGSYAIILRGESVMQADIAQRLKEVLDQTSAALAWGMAVHTYALTAEDVANKYFTLPQTPDGAVFAAVGGVAQVSGVDFAVNGDRLGWENLGLDENGLKAGDVFILIYKTRDVS